MNHHYVPQFLMKSWSENTLDNKVETFRLDLPNLPSSRITPKHTGFEKDLYAFRHKNIDGLDKQFNETNFLQYVDNHGARVKKEIQLRGLKTLSHKDKCDWTLFLMSLLNRQPKSINQLQELGTHLIKSKLRESPEEYYEIASKNDPENLEQFVENFSPGLIEDFGLFNFKSVVNNITIKTKIMKFHWFVCKFKNSPYEIILSDHPCILTKGIDDIDCIVALPLSPNLVFFAVASTKNKEILLKENKNVLIDRINQSSINQASKRVYATSKEPTYNFVKNHIRNNKK